jgi:hypothetical protein
MAQSGIISSVLPGVWGESRFLQQVVLQAFIFWIFVNFGEVNFIQIMIETGWLE